MYLNFFSLLLFSLFLFSAKAQVQPTVNNNAGQIIVDNEINLSKVTELYKKINLEKCPKLINGYRVQVFSCSGAGCTEKVQDEYLKFTNIYPQITAHQVWDPPSHKIRVGDCRNRFEAQMIKSTIQNVFPNTFIVPDYIEPDYFELCEDK